MSNARKQSEMQIAKKLVGYISTWLYSEGDPPEPINDLFLRWMDKEVLPSPGELTLAMRKSNEILSRQQIDI